MSLKLNEPPIPRSESDLDKSLERLPDWRIGLPRDVLKADDLILVLNDHAIAISWVDEASHLWVFFGEPSPRTRAAQSLDAGDADLQRATRLHTSELREHVDCWLATGRTNDGVETPLDRHPTVGIHRVVSEYYITHYVTPVPLRDGYRLLEVPATWLEDISGEGGLAPEVKAFLPSLTEEAKEGALRMFVGMLHSDFRLRIAQCRICRIYFLLSHWKRTFKRGTHCGACIPKVRQASAKVITKVRREDAQTELHRLTARRFRKRILAMAHWYAEPTLKVEIADYLNSAIRKSERLTAIYLSKGRNGVTGKWVARSKNWKAINQAIGELANAKG